MLTRSQRTRMDKEKDKKSVKSGGGEVLSSSSSSSTSKMSSEDDVLIDQMMMDTYRKEFGEKFDGVNDNKGAMMVYRMNIWKEDKKKTSSSSAAQEVGQKKRNKKAKEEGHVLDLNLKDYMGRMEFVVEVKNYASIIQPHFLSKVPLPAYGAFGNGSRRTQPHHPHICGHEKVSTPHCKITGPKYPDDYIWIKDENSEHGTFVNGRKIQGGEKYRLLDGDIIGLGAPHDSSEHWGDDKKKRGFVFKVKSLAKYEGRIAEDTLMDGSSSNFVFMGLNNVVILDKVLACLNYEELKCARMVNKFWKDRATRSLLQKSIVHIGCGWRDDDPDQPGHCCGPRPHAPCPDNFIGGSVSEWCDEFHRNVDMAGNCNATNWDIYNVKTPQCWKNVQWLANNMTNLLQSLRLSVNFDVQTDADQVVQLLGKLASLQTLDLRLVTRKSVLPKLKLASSSSNSNFPSVKNLSIQVIQLHPSLTVSTKSGDAFVASIAPLFPKVENLFGMDVGILKKLLEFTNIATGTRGPIWIGLTKVSADFGKAKTFNEEEEGHDAEFYTALGKLQRKLTALELEGIEIEDEGTITFPITAFEKVLAKHAPTLEHLALKFDRMWNGGNDQDHIIIRFPSFPSLKTLKVDLGVDYSYDTESYGPWPLTIVFPSGPVSYESDLPRIIQLDITPWELSVEGHNGTITRHQDRRNSHAVILNENLVDIKSAAGIFIPKDSDTVSQTMRWVDFRLKPEDCRENNPWFKEFVERFNRMFPHVNHPQVIQGLKLLNIE